LGSGRKAGHIHANFSQNGRRRDLVDTGQTPEQFHLLGKWMQLFRDLLVQRGNLCLQKLHMSHILGDQKTQRVGQPMPFQRRLQQRNLAAHALYSQLRHLGRRGFSFHQSI